MMTKAERKEILDLILTPSVPWMSLKRAKSALEEAGKILDRGTEGQHLPLQLEIAQRLCMLPMCTHSRPLMDWSGEALAPPCGCRLIEPTEEEHAKLMKQPTRIR